MNTISVPVFFGDDVTMNNGKVIDFGTNRARNASDPVDPTDLATKEYVDASAGAGVTPAPLTNINDTNVLLTLNGAPSVALLQAVQLVLGWAGQLAVARGGTGAATFPPHQYFGNNTGATAAPAPHQIDYSELTGTPAAVTDTHTVTFVVNGGGRLLTTGTKSYVKIPYGGILQGWTLIGSPTGSVTIDILRAADTGGLPVSSIVGGGTKPALSSSVENSSTSFSGWTSTTLTAKDNMAISLSGITSTTYLALILYFQ